MGPRKRAKPNPKPLSSDAKEAATDISSAERPPLEQLKHDDPDRSVDQTLLNERQGARESPRSHHAGSWYSGTWSNGNKTFPVTQVARESIHAAVGATSDVVATARAHTPPAIAGSLRKSLARQPAEGSPHSKTLHAGSSESLSTAKGADGTTISDDVPPEKSGTAGKVPVPGLREVLAVGSDKRALSHDAGQEMKEQVTLADQNPTINDAKSLNNDSASWLSWFSRSEQPKGSSIMQPDAEGTSKDSTSTTKEGHYKSFSTSNVPTSDGGVSQPAVVVDSHTAEATGQDKRRSWLHLWPRPAQLPTASLAAPTIGQDALDIATPQASLNDSNKATSNGNPDIRNGKDTESRRQGQRRSSGWAFWSHNDSNQSERQNASEQGELAVAGSPSQTHPERDIVDATQGVPAKVGKQQQSSVSEPSRTSSDQPVDTITEQPQRVADGLKRPAAEPKSQASHSRTKDSSPNLVLPGFRNTYDAINKPGLMQQLARWFHLASLTDSAKHLDVLANPVRIRNALVIGVHGYFPTPFVRSFLGQPTGTSIRFANSAADAVSQWTKAHGYTCEIEKVALEGEGKIAERIELLWGLLLNWIDKIRKADFIFVACHSQGCPVALTLVAKLISFGCVSSARIGVCAMAGVNHGPFTEYKTRWIGSTALELFDFGREDSAVSQEYQTALKIALDFGVKVLYIGSIDDQLVSLESSTFSAMNHPNIYRAVFVDGRVHVPDFLTHLVGFALKLKNLGVSDHGLIRELSSPLAGSLYSGEGHSRIYEDESVYYLAIQHALETTSGSGAQLQRQNDRGGGSQNPYILPFAMRGLLEEEYVRTELQGEIVDLIRQFDEWKPSSKALKDVKFRLEGVRSRL